MATRREQVVERANGRCEYCQLPSTATSTAHEIDHIRALKHHGETVLDNLAFACFYCNSYKQANVAGFDPETDELVPLFNPRTDAWSEHFVWTAAILTGLSATARATIDVLRINDVDRVRHRELLIELGDFPPHD